MGAIRIREAVVRECRKVPEFRGTYTGGNRDPDLIVLFVSVSDGQETGYGECIPTSLCHPPGHAGRSNADEWRELLSLCQGLIGQDARRLGRLVPSERRSHDTNSIVDAVEFALYDLVGRRLGVPVATLLGGIFRPYVTGMPVVHRTTPDQMADRATDWHRRYGFTHFKLKPIGNLEEDTETLRKMRERIGVPLHVVMDANYHLPMTLDQVADYANALYELGLAVYEDPIDIDFAACRDLRKKMRAKLMLDDKARTPEAVLDILRYGCADIINIHANWAGGFQAGLLKASLAAAGGISTMIGSTHYFGPGAAAYQTLSSVLPLEAPCEQVYMEVYGMRSLIRDPYEIRDGKIIIRDAPGLGVTPDMSAVSALMARSETFTA